jgi:hypothetical protein
MGKFSFWCTLILIYWWGHNCLKEEMLDDRNETCLKVNADFKNVLSLGNASYRSLQDVCLHLPCQQHTKLFLSYSNKELHNC